MASQQSLWKRRQEIMRDSHPASIVRALLISFPLLCCLFTTTAASEIFSSIGYDLGNVKKGEDYSFEFFARNAERKNLDIKLISLCDCVHVSPTHIILPAGEKAAIKVVIDSIEEEGEFKHYLIITTNRQGQEKIIYTIRGIVLSNEDKTGAAGGNGSETGHSKNDGAVNRIIIEFYFTPNCKRCLRFLNDEIPVIERELEKSIVVRRFDILEPDVFEIFLKRMKHLNVENTAFPILILNNHVLQGDKEIENNFKQLAKKEFSQIVPPEAETLDEAPVLFEEKKLLFLPVITGGLLDGINPCAFTTLIFLLAALSFAGRGKREVLVIGLFYTSSVFVTYCLIGLGFFKTLRLAESFSVVSQVIKWILFAVLIAFSILSLWDYMRIRNGKAKDMILQLPLKMKQRIHKSIRTHTRSTALIGSSLLMGFFVSLFELGCTGQIYFPTIAYLVKAEKEMEGYIFLLIYNIGFILPLFLVFFLTYKGVSSESITHAFQQNMGKVKLGTAFLFFGLAILTVVI
jgi:cytochrome c biogenesis protein CcdA